MMRPCSITAMRVALRIVDSRCAMTNAMRPANTFAMPR